MAKKKNNGELTSAEIRNIRIVLLTKLSELLGDVQLMENEALRRKRLELSPEYKKRVKEYFEQDKS